MRKRKTHLKTVFPDHACIKPMKLIIPYNNIDGFVKKSQLSMAKYKKFTNLIKLARSRKSRRMRRTFRTPQ